MKYTIDLEKSIFTRDDLKFYHLVDENGSRSSWTIWFRKNEFNAIPNGQTIYSHEHYVRGVGQEYRIPFVLLLNEDNPEESIERIKKLILLK